MAYVTGNTNSFAGLLTAIRNACTANGWTLSGDVLHKGTCYVDLRLGPFPQNAPPVDSHISVLGGNGIDGGNVLTDAAARFGYIGLLRAASGGTTWPDWTWPATYYVHINSSPDEVWVFVNYNVDFWQSVRFGQSPAPGNLGTGNWYSASLSANSFNAPGVDECGSSPSSVASNNSSSFSPMPFWINGGNGGQTSILPAHAIHGAISDADGSAIWSDTNHAYTGDVYRAHSVSIARAMEPLLSMSPSAWNQESILLPMQIIQSRLSAKVSLIGQLDHARACRNDYITPGQTITLGGEQWRVYPAYRKNTDVRNGSVAANHSGTIAIAVRYVP